MVFGGFSSWVIITYQKVGQPSPRPLGGPPRGEPSPSNCLDPLTEAHQHGMYYSSEEDIAQNR